MFSAMIVFNISSPSSIRCIVCPKGSRAPSIQRFELLAGGDEQDAVQQKVRWAAIFSRDGRSNVDKTLGPGVYQGSVLQVDLDSTSMGAIRCKLLRSFARDAVREVVKEKRYGTGLQHFVLSSMQ